MHVSLVHNIKFGKFVVDAIRTQYTLETKQKTNFNIKANYSMHVQREN